MDRLASMHAFVQVVDSGSFAAAAKRLSASPASVTHHVQSLEDHLGVQLLNRTTRKLNLTEVGRDFYEHSSHILAQLEEAERSAATLQKSARGLLRVNTSEGLARVLAPLIAEFSAAYPDVSFDHPASRHLSVKVRAFLDFLARRLISNPTLGSWVPTNLIALDRRPSGELRVSG
ncbi:MAG TPA: LysR family transcriptional regulator [Pirellulales bacterium]|jgi:DNA-binding transcriptional LysR family regulator|nr:LysR family transcriptional regulator [Pirellulales bacterium]